MDAERPEGYDEWKRALYAERGRRVREALAERAAEGRPTGCAPVGYRNAVVDGEKRIVPDEAMAPLVREAFALAATGEYSLRQLLAIMTEKGLRSRNGRAMGVSALWHLLSNRAYAGRPGLECAILPASQTSLISAMSFDRVQDALRGRR